MQRNRWDNVAALYDANRKYFVSTFDKFLEVINVSYWSPVSDILIPLDGIQAEHRVVFVFAGATLACKVLCLAYHFQPALIYPIYQWIFHDRTQEHFWQNATFTPKGTRYSCSQQQKIGGYGGNIRRFKRDNAMAETDVDFTLNDFFDSYQPYLSHHLSEVNLLKNHKCRGLCTSVL